MQEWISRKPSPVFSGLSPLRCGSFIVTAKVILCVIGTALLVARTGQPGLSKDKLSLLETPGHELCHLYIPVMTRASLMMEKESLQHPCRRQAGLSECLLRASQWTAQPSACYSPCFPALKTNNGEKEMEEEVSFPVRNTEIFLQLPSFLMPRLRNFE